MSPFGKYAVCAALSCLVIPALAEDMRCGNQIIQDDQMHPLTTDQVLDICGEPSQRDGERWTYQDQRKVLVFNDSGELVAIEDASEEE